MIILWWETEKEQKTPRAVVKEAGAYRRFALLDSPGSATDILILTFRLQALLSPSERDESFRKSNDVHKTKGDAILYTTFQPMEKVITWHALQKHEMNRNEVHTWLVVSRALSKATSELRVFTFSSRFTMYWAFLSFDRAAECRFATILQSTTTLYE